jgi:hypothetical protein
MESDNYGARVSRVSVNVFEANVVIVLAMLSHSRAVISPQCHLIKHVPFFRGPFVHNFFFFFN